MYRSKRHEPGGHVVFSTERRDPLEQLSFTTRLRRAVEQQNWVLHYQPIVDLADGAVDGVEALIRWQEPTGGLVPPGEFIPLAEELGLIEAIGDWVIDEFAGQHARWAADGLDLTVASTCRHGSCGRRIWPSRSSASSQDAGVDPQRVVVEITESTAMADPDRTQRILKELHAWGLRLAIDDFGTGYSSLARLKHLPVDILKIDRTFIRDVDRDADSGHGHGDDPARGGPRDDPARRGHRDRGGARLPDRARLHGRAGLPLRAAGAGRGDPGARHARRRPRPRSHVAALTPPRPPIGGSVDLRHDRRYDASAIEPMWVARLGGGGSLRGLRRPGRPRPRFYALDMFPYPSGDLHMGHAEAFSGGDAVARYRAMRGYNVLHPIGWDAFGLTAENAAIKRGIAPGPWTYANIEQQAASFKRMGMSFDWSRAAAHLRSRLLPVDPMAVPSALREGPRVSEVGAGELVPEGPDRARERAGDPGRVRTVRHAGRAPRPDAVVLQDHGLRAATAR